MEKNILLWGWIHVLYDGGEFDQTLPSPEGGLLVVLLLRGEMELLLRLLQDLQAVNLDLQPNNHQCLSLS